jgi:hypothetical protein
MNIMKTATDRLRGKIGESISRNEKIHDPKLIMSCDCILRKLEVIEKRLMSNVVDLLKRTSFLGFSTYGEQYDSIHVNQTMTGFVIGG